MLKARWLEDVDLVSMLPLISVSLLIMGALGIQRRLPDIRRHRRQVCFTDLMSPKYISRLPRVHVVHCPEDWKPATKFIRAIQNELVKALAAHLFFRDLEIWDGDQTEVFDSPSYIISVCRQLTSIPTHKFAGVKRDAEVGKFTLYER